MSIRALLEHLRNDLNIHHVSEEHLRQPDSQLVVGLYDQLVQGINDLPQNVLGGLAPVSGVYLEDDHYCKFTHLARLLASIRLIFVDSHVENINVVLSDLIAPVVKRTQLILRELIRCHDSTVQLAQLVLPHEQLVDEKQGDIMDKEAHLKKMGERIVLMSEKAARKEEQAAIQEQRLRTVRQEHSTRTKMSQTMHGTVTELDTRHNSEMGARDEAKKQLHQKEDQCSNLDAYIAASPSKVKGELATLNQEYAGVQERMTHVKASSESLLETDKTLTKSGKAIKESLERQKCMPQLKIDLDAKDDEVCDLKKLVEQTRQEIKENNINVKERKEVLQHKHSVNNKKSKRRMAKTQHRTNEKLILQQQLQLMEPSVATNELDEKVVHVKVKRDQTKLATRRDIALFREKSLSLINNVKKAHEKHAQMLEEQTNLENRWTDGHLSD